MASNDNGGSHAMLSLSEPDQNTSHLATQNGDSLHEEDDNDNRDLDLPRNSEHTTDEIKSEGTDSISFASADGNRSSHVAVSRGGDSGFFRLFRRSHGSKSRRHKLDQRPKIRRYNLLSRDKLKVPMRNSSGHYLSEQGRPLVDIGSDENNEDDDVTYYDSHTMRRLTNAEIRDQLLKDGYNLDDQQDADDLDLIPPRPIEERGFSCCGYYLSCTIL